VPREHEPQLTDSADPFLLAALPLAMSRRCDIYVKGTVSPSLVGNLLSLRDLFVRWWPGLYARARITAECISEATGLSDSRHSMVAFSGGIDSSYSLYRHVRRLGEPPHHSIGCALMVHGFDIPLWQTSNFEAAFAKARVMTDSLSLPLIPVATNLRHFPLIWHVAFGPAIAAVMELFGRGYGADIIASGHQLPPHVPEGSHPLSDPLLSSATFPIVHDGADVTKLDKLRTLQSWPELLKHLRVCWEGPDNATNCGQCEKCIRTILYFRLLGVFPPCFSRDVTDEQISRMHIPYFSLKDSYRFFLQYAREHDIQESWVSALAGNVSRHKNSSHRKWGERVPFPLYAGMYRAMTLFNEWRARIPRYDD